MTQYFKDFNAAKTAEKRKYACVTPPALHMHLTLKL